MYQDSASVLSTGRVEAQGQRKHPPLPFTTFLSLRVMIGVCALIRTAEVSGTY
jgi:hypothetical protein